MVDLDQVAVAAHPPGVGDGAAVGGVDRRAVAVGNVDALVVGGADAAGGGPSAEGRGNAAGGGPPEGAGGQPGGPLLGAPQLLLRHGFLQCYRGEHRPGGLLAVDIGDVGHHVGGAVLTLGSDLVIALIEVGGVGVLDVVHHILHVVLPLDHGHGQVGHGGGQGQHFTDLNFVNVVAGVHGQQFLGGHAVVLGDLRPGVTLDYGVGDFLLLGAVQGLGQVAQVHNPIRGHQLLPDLHILCEGAGDGVFIGGGTLELAEQLLQRALIGGGADQLALHIQAVSGGDHAQLLGQIRLQRVLIHHQLAGNQTVGVLQQGVINGIGLAQGPGGNLLQIGADLLGRGLGIHYRHHLSVIADGGSHCVEGAKQHHGRQTAGQSQKCGGMKAVALQPAAHTVQTLMAPLAAGQGPLGQPAGGHGTQAPEKQKQLDQKVVRFGKALGLLLPDNSPPAAAGQAILSGEDLPQNNEGTLGALRRPQTVHDALPLGYGGIRLLEGDRRLLRPGGNGSLDRCFGPRGLLLAALPPVGARRNVRRLFQRGSVKAFAASGGRSGARLINGGFFTFVAHIVSCDKTEKVTICYRFMISSFLPFVKAFSAKSC